MPDNNSIKHLAIIMDGNGRWAQSRGQKRIDGHVRGAEVAIDIVESCVRRGIPVLTLYALSVENLQRDPAEVAFITNLVVKTLTRKQESLIENGVRVKIIGDMNHFDDKVQETVRLIEKVTEDNTGSCLNIAFNYSGRWQIQQALSFATSATNTTDGKSINQRFEAYLRQDMKSDPDLLIRTGGEKRLSNFLLWHLAYTELLFTDTLWPDFSPSHLAQALEKFSTRERRFGKEARQFDGLAATTA
ncbi:MAG: di-trans,poly-cis-decaprenylcistransferase [Legionellales bacterium]|nr:di-trans,poly-cis-decaprenylcistransferase [Legionellales bacterium]